jgi:hypothetical protein
MNVARTKLRSACSSASGKQVPRLRIHIEAPLFALLACGPRTSPDEWPIIDVEPMVSLATTQSTVCVLDATGAVRCSGAHLRKVPFIGGDKVVELPDEPLTRMSDDGVSRFIGLTAEGDLHNWGTLPYEGPSLPPPPHDDRFIDGSGNLSRRWALLASGGLVVHTPRHTFELPDARIIRLGEVGFPVWTMLPGIDLDGSLVIVDVSQPSDEPTLRRVALSQPAVDAVAYRDAHEEDVACALSSDGGLTCVDIEGQAVPSLVDASERLVRISARLPHVGPDDEPFHRLCGLREDGTARCWDDDGEASVPFSPPQGTRFIDIRGEYALTDDGRVTCVTQSPDRTGCGYQDVASRPPGTAVVARYRAFQFMDCLLFDDGDVHCLHSIHDPSLLATRVTPIAGLLACKMNAQPYALPDTKGYVCVQAENGRVTCNEPSVLEDEPLTMRPLVSVTSATEDGEGCCGLTQHGKMLCDGPIGSRIEDMIETSESMIEIAYHSHGVLALRADGTLWLASPEETEPWVPVDAAVRFAHLSDSSIIEWPAQDPCVAARDGAIYCDLTYDRQRAAWTFEREVLPPGLPEVRALSDRCALREDDSMTCWGRSFEFPSGLYYTGLSGGCATASDGSLSCIDGAIFRANLFDPPA